MTATIPMLTRLKAFFEKKLPQLVNFRRMPLVCMICTGISGSGARILGTVTMRERQTMAVLGLIMIIILGCCAGVLGATILGTVAVPIVLGSSRTTGTKTSVFELFVLRGLNNPLLFYPFILYERALR